MNPKHAAKKVPDPEPRNYARDRRSPHRNYYGSGGTSPPRDYGNELSNQYDRVRESFSGGGGSGSRPRGGFGARGGRGGFSPAPIPNLTPTTCSRVHLDLLLVPRVATVRITTAWVVTALAPARAAITRAGPAATVAAVDLGPAAAIIRAVVEVHTATARTSRATTRARPAPPPAARAASSASVTDPGTSGVGIARQAWTAANYAVAPVWFGTLSLLLLPRRSDAGLATVLGA
ncbi:hypothetical protein B0H66DRAFT_604823 [Apodospora peruviana]|uniref:Uncharacterized protein n=1 Tax=Apodospora peruviana TaxID=516989 RepID=A0AAE0I124_9PEZI|nr:hypothetical protein B0H66DRAFT_604823 [Apodospora peruviana]